MAAPPPIRIAFVITGLGQGGAEMMLVKLLRRLDRTRFAPSVVCLSAGGPLAEALRAIDIPPIILGRARGGFLVSGMQQLVKALRAIRPHIVHGWMYHGNFAATLAAGMLDDAPKLLWNVRMAGDDLRTEKRLTRLLVHVCAPLASRAACIVTNSRRSALTHAVRFGYRGRWRVIPNGFDTEVFSPVDNERPQELASLSAAGAVLIGLIARYHAIKDHGTFFAAAAMLSRAYPHVRFVLAGDGMSRDNVPLERQIASHGLADKVLLLGPRADIARVTASLDIATLSSVSEGFPNVVGEAMSCAVPCVVTDVGDAALIVGDTGLIVRPRDPAEMCAAWSELTAMRAPDRRALGLRARQRIVDHFSIGAVAETYHSLFDEVASASNMTACAA